VWLIYIDLSGGILPVDLLVPSLRGRPFQHTLFAALRTEQHLHVPQFICVSIRLLTTRGYDEVDLRGGFLFDFVVLGVVDAVVDRAGLE
jgi:hypothetical protein